MREFFVPREEVDEIERVIADLCRGRTPSVHGINALKSIASGLRARLPGEPGKTLRALEGYVVGALRTKNPVTGDYTAGSLKIIAQTILGQWHVIRSALEKYEEEIGK